MGLVTARREKQKCKEAPYHASWFSIVPVLVVSSLSFSLPVTGCSSLWLISPSAFFIAAPSSPPTQFSLLLLISTFHFIAYVCIYISRSVCSYECVMNFPSTKCVHSHIHRHRHTSTSTACEGTTNKV